MNLVEHEPIVLVTAIGAAKLMGRSRQRVSQMLQEGEMPPPFAMINGSHPAWHPSQFDELIRDRSKARRRSS